MNRMIPIGLLLACSTLFLAACDSRIADVERASGIHLQRPPIFLPVASRTFAAPWEEGWFSDLTNPSFGLVVDSTAPSGPRVGEIRYPEGFPAGRTPGWSETWGLEERELTRIYISFWTKLSENWQGHPAVSKIGFVWIHDNPVVFPVYRGAGLDPLRAEIWLQDVPDGGRRLEANVGEREIKRGRWHRWEIYLVANGGDEADGEAHFWIDGEKIGEYRDIRFGTREQSDVWERVSWRPIWGGVAGVVPEEMYMRMGRITVSGPTPQFNDGERWAGEPLDDSIP